MSLLPLVLAAREGAPCPALPPLPRGPGRVHVTLRRAGRRRAALWAEADSMAAALWDALVRALAEARDATSVEITLALPDRPLWPGFLTRAEASDVRGRYGVAVEGGARIGPLEMIARNLGPGAALERLGPGRALVFDTRAWLVQLDPAREVALERGVPLVPEASVSRGMAQALARGMQDWLVAQVGPDGRMGYLYNPATGVWSAADNMIRQFMASTALAEAAQADGRLAPIVARNFAFNFKAYFRQEGDLGLIVEGEKVKLGAAACALMAILALPDPGPWQAQAGALARFILSMQRADGSFRTFLRPEGRDDCQNFYPGEAVLALVQLQARLPGLDLMPRLLAAFRHYRTWHRSAPNPAFVPWWTRAMVAMHDQTGRGDLADFALQMNDWLITLQAGDDRPEVIRGDFFHPAHPDYGPPHASATGVYLEGLIEAHGLAQRLGHRGRAERYRLAILRGLRALRQLQFKGGEDSYFLGHPERVLGGLRTSVHDSRISIDNVQHGLMAVRRTLDRWDAEAFRISG